MDGALFSVLWRAKNVLERNDSLALREDPPAAEDEVVSSRTAVESVVFCLYTVLRNLYLCELTSREALFPDKLKGVRQRDAPQIFTAFKGAVLDSLQSGRQFDLLYCTLLEDSVVQSAIIRVLVCPEYLKSLIEFHSLEIAALRERALRNDSE